MRKKKTRADLPMILADAADYEGITVEDLATNPTLLKKHKINPKGLTGGLIYEAHEIHRKLMDGLLARIDAGNRRAEEQRRARFDSTFSQPTEGERTMATKTNKTNGKGTKATETTTAPVKEKKETAKKEQKPSRRKALVFDKYSATSVVRWMGSKKWTVEQARAVIDKVTKGVKDSTLKLQLRDGTKGKDAQYGTPAELTGAEEKKLNALRKTAK